MFSEDPAEPKASQPSDAKAGTAEAPVAFMDPRHPCEVASGGGGEINDPAGNDTKPPRCAAGFEVVA